MPQPRRQSSGPAAPLRDFLLFDRLITGRLIHLVYWAGLGVILLVVFGVLGTAAGLALGEGLQGVLLALPVLVGGLLVSAALALLWRSFCEFYLAIFRISEDLSALRAGSEAGAPALAQPGQPLTAQPAAPAASEFRRYF